jgi:hypothetical protein
MPWVAAVDTLAGEYDDTFTSCFQGSLFTRDLRRRIDPHCRGLLTSPGGVLQYTVAGKPRTEKFEQDLAYYASLERAKRGRYVQPELTTPLTSRTCLTPSTSSLQILSNGSITARHLHAFSNAWHDLAGHSRRVLETFVTLIKSSLITLALCSRLDLC